LEPGSLKIGSLGLESLISNTHKKGLFRGLFYYL